MRSRRHFSLIARGMRQVDAKTMGGNFLRVLAAGQRP